MCGRFLLTSPAQAIAEAFGVEPPVDLAPRWNIAPGQPVLAVRTGADGGRTLASLRWGLVPWWSNEVSRGATLINARAETAATTPAFRDAFRARRCLVPATGFYEWRASPPPVDAREDTQQADLFPSPDEDRAESPPRGREYRLRGQRSSRAGPRQPFLIGLHDGAPFAFAGLWERWRPRAGEEPALESCAILTTTPNDLVAPIHDRMPVILPRTDFARWLDLEVSDVDVLRSLLRPYPAQEMRAEPVSTWVNDPRHDDARCAEPL